MIPRAGATRSAGAAWLCLHLRRFQETQAAEPKHAQTYLQLRQLYLKDGRTEDAKAVLDRGLARFPDDEELKKARDGAK